MCLHIARIVSNNIGADNIAYIDQPAAVQTRTTCSSKPRQQTTQFVTILATPANVFLVTTDDTRARYLINEIFEKVHQREWYHVRHQLAHIRLRSAHTKNNDDDNNKATRVSI